MRSSLVRNLSEIDRSKLIPLEISEDGGYKLAKIIVNSPDSSRRVEEKCEVKMVIQKYVCVKEDGCLKVFNKDYKQVYGKLIEKMTHEECVIRKCLLTMFDSQVVWFIVNRASDANQTNIAARELKIDNWSIYDDYLYYLITLESIVFPQPIEPKSIHTFDKFIKKYQEEIRYLIRKELYKDAISWSNTVLTKFFNMSKELKKQMIDDIKAKLLPEMKPILLNKSLALMKKQNKENKKDYEDTIKVITKEYYTHFPIDRDEKYIKITLRLAICYLEVKDLDNCEATYNELIKYSNDEIDEDIKNIKTRLDELRNQNKKKNKKTLIDFFNTKMDCNELRWDCADVLEKINVECNLDQSIINLLN